MDIATFSKYWSMLLAAFPSSNLSDKQRRDRRDIYAVALKNLDPAVWEASVTTIIATNKWFPTLAEIFAVARTASGVPSRDEQAAEAFSLALAAVRRLDPLTSRPLFPVRADVEHTVRRLGGWGRLALVENDSISWYRKEFVAAWSTSFGETVDINGIRALQGRSRLELPHEKNQLGPGPLALASGDRTASDILTAAGVQADVHMRVLRELPEDGRQGG